MAVKIEIHLFSLPFVYLPCLGLKNSAEEYGPTVPPVNHMIGPVCPQGLGKKDNSTSDSESDSSSSDDDAHHKYKKTKQKHKRRKSSSDSDTKRSSKKKRRQKRSSSDSDSSDSSRERNSKKNMQHSCNSEARRSAIGPMMPSSYSNTQSASNVGRSVGPSLPPTDFSSSHAAGAIDDDDSDDDGIGPRIEMQVKEGELSAVQEFVERNEKMNKKLLEQV